MGFNPIYFKITFKPLPEYKKKCVEMGVGNQRLISHRANRASTQPFIKRELQIN